ncbi:GNAT family N-acetyltransferase [Treponema pedis]|uniref:GNAT family N-acetyltransferase n=1 Tax=Treponema pedis TaxID=409322 RepID=UPI00197E55E8|nr:GNAT family N-acetyltransferase [Treponema pedis]QSI03667.1 GNAT family N-acetyltransferase [Treponema pedis]
MKLNSIITDSIEFKEVTPDNWRIINSLSVKEEQKNFAASNVTILARAFVYRKENAKVFAVYYEDKPVGLIMQRDWIDGKKTVCIMDQFMIDKRSQGKGLGKAALKKWLLMIESEKKYPCIQLCYVEGDIPAKHLYENFGFYEIGKDEDEIIMQKDL